MDMNNDYYPKTVGPEVQSVNEEAKELNRIIGDLEGIRSRMAMGLTHIRGGIDRLSGPVPGNPAFDSSDNPASAIERLYALAKEFEDIADEMGHQSERLDQIV